ncbi:BTAD domain-containing putative transcriptional regulator [Nonomuraea sp. B12E4]|uniref:ATP-binding protein n=1 Tax=Nonomuraea sp. B12E4 TaxID=3153564 RepID=UPI00325C6B3B
MLIRLAGLVSIEDGDGSAPRHLSSAQAQIAFARLILERSSGTGRDQLADTVWPGGLPDTWASALRSVVSRVRAFVAGSMRPDAVPLVAQGGRYVLGLPDDAVVDVEQAERAADAAVEAYAAGRHAAAQSLAGEAVTVLRQPFLPDHEGEWVTTVRERLHDLLVSALETASLAASALHDEHNALRFADEAVKAAPLRESAYRALMLAFAAAGNRGEALRCYQHLRRALAEELGVDPAPETQAVYMDLLGAPDPSGRSRGRTAPDVPFTGRRAELKCLAEAWTAAREGAGHVVLVTGEPGAGKSRLVGQAARQAGMTGATVIYVRCDRGSAPGRPFRQALLDFLAATPAEQLPQLGRRSRATLAALVADSAHPGLDPAERHKMYLAVADLLVEVARDRPVFAVVDDVDLSGPDVLEVLRHAFMRAGDGLPLLVVATATGRPRHAGEFTDLVQDLEQARFLRRMGIGGLGESDVLALSRAILPAGDVPLPYQLIHETGGNAYLLLELLRWHRERRDGLPPSILTHTATRLAPLGGPARQLLRAAAVAGRSFELDLAAEAAALDLEAAMDCLDALVAGGILTEVVPGWQGDEYRFTHEVLRRAVYEQLSPTRRRWLHARLADAIEHLRPLRLGAYSRALAHHRAAGATPRGDQRAVTSSWRAAARASLDGAQTEAVRLHQQALDHVPASSQELGAEALIRLGLAQLAAGHDGCEQNLIDGTIQAMRVGRLDIAAEAVLGLADAAGLRPRFRSESAALIEMLLQAARPGAIDDLVRGRLLARRHLLGERPTPGPSVTRALDAMAVELRRLEGPDHVSRRFVLAGEALRLATAAGEHSARVVAAHHRAAAAQMAGETQACQEALAALASAVIDGDEIALGDALLLDHAVATAVAQGRFTDAAAIGTRLGPGPDDAPFTAADSHGITPAPGSLAHRQLLIARWLRKSCWPAIHHGPLKGVELSLASLMEGDKGVGRLTVRALAIGAEPLPAGGEWLHHVGLLALCAAELGDPDTADALRGLLTPYAHLTCGVGYRSFVGPASFHLGRLAVVTGDWDEAERHLMFALSQLSGHRARPWTAIAQHDLARALEARARTGDRRWAQALRSEADGTLTSLGVKRSA